MTELSGEPPSSAHRVVTVLMVVAAVGVMVHIVLEFSSATPPPHWTGAFMPAAFALFGINCLGWPHVRGTSSHSLRVVGICMLLVALLSFVDLFSKG